MSSHQHSLPEAFVQSLDGLPGFNRAPFCETHALNQTVTSIRLNPSKKAAANNYGFRESGPVPWAGYGRYLQERPSFTLDPLFHAGAYYVQEASSMFLEQVISQTVDLNQPLQVLDLCAAPGGKSTHLQSLLSADSLLVSNEVIKTRSGILQENLTKWGGINGIVTQNDPADFKKLPGFFDVIVVDAPCSGSGMFRKDVDAINEWSIDHVSLCSQRQKRILADILPALKEGGVLIYSTCSYSKNENEEVVDWLMDSHHLKSLSITTAAFEGIVVSPSEQLGGWGYRFYPNLLQGEGFFIAALQKQLSSAEAGKKYNATKLEKFASKHVSAIQSWIQSEQSLSFFQQNDEVVVLPASIHSFVEIIKSSLYIKKAGMSMGAMVRDTFIPSHGWAMSSIQSNIIPTFSLELEQARQYLRHQHFDYPDGLKGWYLVKYAEVPLGLVKCMPGRLNNYYPRDWRILNK